MNPIFVPALADLIAITALAGIYFSRHERRDLLLAYVSLNMGVFAVTAVLSDATVGAGLGLGLFGILSIIRLRSDSITQEEIAYYFVALALGLVTGLHPGATYLAPTFCTLLVAVMYVADHPALFPRSRRQLITIDAAIADESELRFQLEQRLEGDIRHFLVQEVDFVRDLTIVDVRFRHLPHAPREVTNVPSAIVTGVPGRDAPVLPVGVEVAVQNGHQVATSPRGLGTAGTFGSPASS